MITALNVWSDAPLLVAANRDEHLDRPSEPPAERPWGPDGSAALAPRDAVAGGTWWGLNAAGLFVAITNRFGARPDPARRSRGLLVLDALAHHELDAATADVAGRSGTEHNPFHLLLLAGAGTRAAGGAGAPARGHLVWSDGPLVHRRVLEDGVVVVTERSLGAAEQAREHAVQRLMVPLLPAQDDRAAKAPDDAALAQVLESRDDDLWRSVTVRIPSIGYGTRASTILRMGPEGTTLRHADAPPPDRAWVDYSPLVPTR